MTAFNIIRSMARRGNAVLGTGCYAAALSLSNSAQIVKIGNNMQDPWLQYYAYVKDNQHNITVPQVSRLYIDERYSYYTCVMERLSESGEQNGYKAKDICKDYAEGWHTQQEFLNLIADYTVAVPDPVAMLATLSYIKRQAEACNFKVDLHRGNFMYRDKVLVVTDPWADTDINLDASVCDWADVVFKN